MQPPPQKNNNKQTKKRKQKILDFLSFSVNMHVILNNEGLGSCEIAH